MKRLENDTNDIVEAALAALRPDADGNGIIDPLDELTERRTTDAVLSRFDREVTITAKPRPARRWVAVAILCIGVGFGTYLSVSSPNEQPSEPVFVTSNAGDPGPKSTKNPTVIPGSRFALVLGQVASESGPISVGSEIPTAERIRTTDGQTAISLPTGIAAGLAENTSVRVLWNGNRQYGLSILNGMVLFSVDPKQARSGFFVDTAEGTVHVKGTLFTVIVSPEDGVVVKLHRGEVVVERPGGLKQILMPGDLVHLDSNKRVAQTVSDKVQSQLQAFRCMDRGDVFTELSHVECLGGAAESSTISSVSPERNDGKFVTGLSIRDLMNLARSQKTDGNWKGAVSSYQELIRLHPKSDEARTSMVSLAQIQLNHLGNPRGALKQFSRYLKQPGPLTQEAMYGRAEAIRAIGDTRREEKALVQFLASYPEGLYAKSVRKRLGELRAKADSP